MAQLLGLVLAANQLADLASHPLDRLAKKAQGLVELAQPVLKHLLQNRERVPQRQLEHPPTKKVNLHVRDGPLVALAESELVVERLVKAGWRVREAAPVVFQILGQQAEPDPLIELRPDVEPVQPLLVLAPESQQEEHSGRHQQQVRHKLGCVPSQLQELLRPPHARTGLMPEVKKQPQEVVDPQLWIRRVVVVHEPEQEQRQLPVELAQIAQPKRRFSHKSTQPV